MTNDLLNYMTERYKKNELPNREPGPVITFSRETGCPAKKIAQRLSEILTEINKAKGKELPWKWISKEIMIESARELKVDPANIEYVFNYEDHGIIHDILFSHSSKYYKGDRIIKKTIAQVIRTLASKGNVIIVGRGGVSITHDIPHSLHIHFEAPLEWRSIMLSQKYNIPVEEARNYATHIDQKREEFRNLFEGKKNDYTTFNAKFNCMTLSVEEIAQSISKLAEVRKFV
jgi:cytidylate kinase